MGEGGEWGCNEAYGGGWGGFCLSGECDRLNMWVVNEVTDEE